MNDIGIETEWRVIEGSPEEGVPSNLLGECNFRCFLSRERKFHLPRAWQMHNGSSFCVGLIEDCIPSTRE